jgi:hypothetical protein
MLIDRTFSAAEFVSSAAEGVDETSIVRVVGSCGGDVLFADRHQRDPHPLFPFVWALRVLIGIKQQPTAGGAASLLDTDQVPNPRVQRWGCCSAATLTPVVGQRRVVGRGSPGNHAWRTILVQANFGRKAPLSRSPNTHLLRLVGLNRP